MKKDVEEYYSRYFDLFLHPGWKQFVEGIQDSLDEIADSRTIKDQRDLDFRQGQLRVLDHLLSFERLQKEVYEAILQEEDNDI